VTERRAPNILLDPVCAITSPPLSQKLTVF
jgi:hypothetical protein